MDLWKDFKETLPFGAVIGGISIGAASIVNNLKIPTITFSAVDVNVREQISQGINPTFGEGVLKYFQGLVPNSIEGYLAIIISAIILVYAGFLLYKTIGMFGVKESAGSRAVMILLYASIVFTIISTMLLKVDFSVTAVSMLIYFALLGFAGYMIGEYLPIKVPN